MPQTTQANGLTRRVNACLAKAGIPIEKKSIRQALLDGRLIVHTNPLNYGKYAHRDVCRWAGVDPLSLPEGQLPCGTTPYVDDCLSYRAHRCLQLAGISRTKEALLQALQTGMLSPGKCPNGYGIVTHAEVCRWVGFRAAEF